MKLIKNLLKQDILKMCFNNNKLSKIANTALFWLVSCSKQEKHYSSISSNVLELYILLISLPIAFLSKSILILNYLLILFRFFLIYFILFAVESFADLNEMCIRYFDSTQKQTRTDSIVMIRQRPKLRFRVIGQISRGFQST